VHNIIRYKARSPAVAKVSRPYRLYPKANVRFPVVERKQFPRVSTLWWRCYIEYYNQR